MKAGTTLISAAFAAFTMLNSQKVSAQSWVQGGNTVTKDTTLGTKNAFALKMITANAERMRITSTGNVGIGTLNPLVRFHVENTGASEIARFAGGTGMRLNLYESGANRGYIGSVAGNAGDVDFGTDGGNTSGSVHLTIKTSPKLTINSSGNVGIGITTPNASSLLELQSTSKGLLIPRMTKAQRDLIVSPATGLMIYQTDNGPGFYYYNSNWLPLSASSNVHFDKQNLFIGIDYLNGDSNTVVGSGAMALNESGISNSAFGYLSLGLNTTGNSNTAMGYRAMMSNQTGSNNVATGYVALQSNTTGDNNTASGYQALYSNTTGYENAASGSSSLYSNTTGFQNTASGNQALYSNERGNGNTAFGNGALNSNTTGYCNTASGTLALSKNTTGAFNTAVGFFANVSGNNLVNATVIGNFATVNASNKVAIGNNSVSVIGGPVGWSTFSDGRFKKNVKENVPGLAFINKLKPVTYNVEVKKIEQFLGVKDSTINAAKDAYNAAERKLHTGFVAQEVEKAAQSMGYDFDGVNHPQNENDNYSLVYADFVPSLVKAVQELDTENKKLKNEIDDLKQMITGFVQNSGSAISNQTGSNMNAVLGQNQPNPFRAQTVIPVKLPAQFTNASIVITETATGRIIKTIAIAANTTQVNIESASLPSGTLAYTLYIDGRKMETKQMINLEGK